MEPPTATGDTVVEVADPLVDEFRLKLNFKTLLVGGVRHHTGQAQLYLPV